KVLHLAIDYLIGNINEAQTIRLSHKYGFKNSDDFLLAIRMISKCYENFALETTSESLSQFSCINPEMSRLVTTVLAARHPEVTKHVGQWECIKSNNFIESFVWDTRLILGDSNLGGNVYQITTINLSYRHSNTQNRLVFEMNYSRLCNFIDILENSLAQ
ncbi:hypothetical protein KR038_007539, partial [Drosophila bunnanda]